MKELLKDRTFLGHKIEVYYDDHQEEFTIRSNIPELHGTTYPESDDLRRGQEANIVLNMGLEFVKGYRAGKEAS